MPLKQEDKIAFASVAGFGGFAGLLSFANSVYTNGGAHDLLGLALAAGLGAVASMVFLFVIVNTDRSDLLRLISFALLAGFFYKPVFDISASYIQERREVEQYEQARGALRDLNELKVQLAEGAEWDADTSELAADLIATVRTGVENVDDQRLRESLLVQSRNLQTELAQLEGQEVPNLREFSELSVRELPPNIIQNYQPEVWPFAQVPTGPMFPPNGQVIPNAGIDFQRFLQVPDEG